MGLYHHFHCPLFLTKAEAISELKFYPGSYVEGRCEISVTSPHSVQVQVLKERWFERVNCFIDSESGQPLAAWLQNSLVHFGFLRVRNGKYKGPVVFYISKTRLHKEFGIFITEPVFAFPCFSDQTKKALRIDLI